MPKFLDSHSWGMAVAYYQNLIYLIGGYTEKPAETPLHTIIRYNIKADSFEGTATSGSSIITKDAFGMAQFYTTVDNTVYMLSDKQVGDYYISSFDLETQTFDPTWQKVVPHGDYESACIASDSNFLFVIGGDTGTPDKSVEVMEISTKIWTSVGDTMEYRLASACIAHNNTVWVIGGLGPGLTELSSIEKMDISSTDLSNWKWEISKYPLKVPAAAVRAVVFEEKYILVIGGSDFVKKSAITSVQIIHTDQDGLTTEGPPLNHFMMAGAAITVNDVVYVFGGESKTQSFEFALDESSDDDIDKTVFIIVVVIFGAIGIIAALAIKHFCCKSD